MFLATKVFVMCFLGIIVLGGVTQVHAVVRNYKFEVIKSSHTRLCFNKTMLTVNGQYPGPTIYARKGDLVIVDVINRGDENITLHWHGVKMPRYPWSDGTDFITQCALRPGTRFIQRIILSDEEGTLWWHAHSDWTRATVFGAIIILPPKTETYPFPKPHARVPIILGEWWNTDMKDIMVDFLARGRAANVSDAFVINGQPGFLHQCSSRDIFKLKVEFGKTYLIRMVSAMMNYIMFFKFANHNITVVGSDGAYTKPLKSDYIAISPGQTLDFLLEANQPPSHYYMAGRVYARGADYIPTTGLIEYAGNYTPPSSPPFPYFPVYEDDTWAPSNIFTSQMRSLANDKYPIDVPKNISLRMFQVVAINDWPCNKTACELPERIIASITNISFVPTTTDILQAYYRGINGIYTADFPDFPTFAFDYTHGPIRNESAFPQFKTSVRVLEYNAEVEIVFQATNYRRLDHPMHLHGHSFYVLGSGHGNFDPTRDPPNYNLVDPPLVATITVPRLGWTAIRFKANNPGVWYMHCHFERHLSWGMNMAFIIKDGEGPNEKMLLPPPDMPPCAGQLPHLSSHLGKFNNSVESTI